MEQVILIIHLILALCIIGLILLQRSEGGGLGIGGGSGGISGLASAGTTGNILTKATALCATAFFCTSLTLGVLAGNNSSSKNLLESLDNPPAVVDTIDKKDDNKIPKAKASEDSLKSDIPAPTAPLSE